MRAAFLIGSRSRRRQWLLRLKYLHMRRRGWLYPDVFCLPNLIAETVDLVRDDERLPDGRHDLIFSELNGSEQELADLLAVVRRTRVPVIVMPGPPEILSAVLQADASGRKRALASEIVGSATVWAYGQEISDYCAEELGARRTDVVPWLFDTAATRAIAGRVRRGDGLARRIVFNVPLRFAGPARNDAALRVLESVWARLPERARARVTFHAFAYTTVDADHIRAAAAAAAIPLSVEPRRGYGRFVRFIAAADAVVNFSVGAILGRVTFIAAATGRPGLWTDNVAMNRALYPAASVSLADEPCAGAALEELIRAVVDGDIDDRFHPSAAAVALAGDLAAHTTRLRALAADLLGRVA